MSIQALSPSTTRQLSSTQIILDPSTAVRELIDNAIDAYATSISIEISPNTVDSLQVRDNGRGIAPEDRALVARRHCTSKLRDFQELKGLGGRTLGFRGEALAALADCTGAMMITTRLEGEETAKVLEFGRDGEVVSTANGSQATGTTVRVQNFFQHFPVRRQSALKNSAKYLAQIRHLLEAYALVRPTVRLSLRVRGLTSAGDWQYAPKPGASVEDAAYKVAGRECVKECAWSVIESDGYVVQAFLPRADAQPGKVSSRRTYLSIDSRLVCPLRGALKQIVTEVKKRMKEAISTSKDVKDPFVYLNIVCPPESYDPNVEPAKDDVLFDDASNVLKAIDMMLDAHYPAASVMSPPSTSAIAASVQQSDGYNSDGAASFSTALDTGDPAPLSSQVQKFQAPTKIVRPLYPHGSLFTSSVKSNMYGYDENYLESILDDTPSVADEDEDEDEDEYSVRDVTVSNPWTVAKMNSAMRPRRPPTVNTKLVITSTTDKARSARLPTPQPSSSPRRDAEIPTIDLERELDSFRQRVQSVRGTSAHSALPLIELEGFGALHLPASSQDDSMLSRIERPDRQGPSLPNKQTAVQRSAKRHKQGVNEPFVSPAFSQEAYERHVWAFDPTSSQGMHSSRPKRNSGQHHLDLRDPSDQVPQKRTPTERVRGAAKSVPSMETGRASRDIRDCMSTPVRPLQAISRSSSSLGDVSGGPEVLGVQNKAITTELPPANNHTVHQPDVDQIVEVHTSKPDEHVELASKRRRTTDHGGLRRTKSLGIPPARMRTTGLVVTVCTTLANLSVSLRSLRPDHQQGVAWESVGTDKDGFAPLTNNEIRAWSRVLSTRLGGDVESEMLTDALQRVFWRH